MSEPQFYSFLILLALAIIALLQTILLQGKRKWVGIIAVFLILALGSFALIYKANPVTSPCSEQKNSGFAKSVVHQKSGFLIPDFQKEFSALESSIREPLPTHFASDMEQETFARKVLSLREKTTHFFQKVHKHKFPSDYQVLHQEIIRSAEHLRAAAFAFYAGASSEDSSFREFQTLQKKEQLEQALKHFDEYKNLQKKSNFQQKKSTTGLSYE